MPPGVERSSLDGCSNFSQGAKLFGLALFVHSQFNAGNRICCRYFHFLKPKEVIA